MTTVAKLLTCTILAAGITAGAAGAETLRWARSADNLTMDPHSQNTGPTHAFNHQIYEPLVIRALDGGLRPTLATEWRILEEDPTVWEFKLRQGVKFHDGADFTAEDVVFSIERAKMPTSNMKELLASVEEVTAVDDHTVHMRTAGPNPLLVDNLTNLFMMDRGWAEANNAAVPQNFDAGEEHFAARNANGTGPYVLVSREPDARNVARAFEDYWGKDEFPLDVTEIVYTPITSAATRVAALLSGEVDFVQDVPVQDIARLEQTAGIRVTRGPENRTIFFGMNVGSDELTYGTAEGNPFKDKRVRQAINMAIDREAIQQVVMRGESIPLGTIAPPFINGYEEWMGAYPAVDVDAAKALLAEAGYPDGFQVTLHCPNDRYVNDEGICQAAVGMLGRIGINATLESRSLSIHFPGISNMETDFFLLGWGVPTFDSLYVFDFLYHCREGGKGSWNATRFCDPELDAQIGTLASEPDFEKRNATIRAIWERVQDETIYVPIHVQTLARAMKDTLDIPVDPSNDFYAKDVVIAN
jgi:peptide/nickel transport system substrate-binding protein